MCNKTNNWIEAEGIKCWGISYNKNTRDTMRATITEDDVYNCLLNDFQKVCDRLYYVNKSAQQLIDDSE